jgi:curved DNA-binding protein CbpA
MQMRIRGLLFSVMFVLVFSTVQAQQTMVEFSADTVESDMQGGERTGKLYVGKDRTRTEIDVNGQSLIQIIDLKAQEALMINTQEKSFLRRKAGGGETMSTTKTDAGSPCAGMQNITCKKTGKEQIYGRPAIKWEFTNKAGGQEESMTVWLDEERGIPTRQDMPDGNSIEMRMVGPDSVGGRKTEKWELIVTGPDGKSSSSYQWYDPVIKMNIREEGANGYFRELRNIRLGKQPDSLFKVPAGYKEITMPQELEEQGDR